MTKQLLFWTYSLCALVGCAANNVADGAVTDSGAVAMDAPSTDSPAVVGNDGSASADTGALSDGSTVMTDAGQGASDGASDASSAVINCNPAIVGCNTPPPPCRAGTVPSVVNRCWGACVLIDECVCNAPTDCPMPEQYTCNMGRMRCTPFL